MEKIEEVPSSVTDDVLRTSFDALPAVARDEEHRLKGPWDGSDGTPSVPQSPEIGRGTTVAAPLDSQQGLSRFRPATLNILNETQNDSSPIGIWRDKMQSYHEVEVVEPSETTTARIDAAESHTEPAFTSPQMTPFFEAPPPIPLPKDLSPATASAFKFNEQSEVGQGMSSGSETAESQERSIRSSQDTSVSHHSGTFGPSDSLAPTPVAKGTQPTTSRRSSVGLGRTASVSKRMSGTSSAQDDTTAQLQSEVGVLLRRIADQEARSTADRDRYLRQLDEAHADLKDMRQALNEARQSRKEEDELLVKGWKDAAMRAETAAMDARQQSAKDFERLMRKLDSMKVERDAALKKLKTIRRALSSDGLNSRHSVSSIISEEPRENN